MGSENQKWQARRQLPTWSPQTTEQLEKSGVTRWQLQREYTRVARGVWVPNARIEAGEYCIVGRCRAQYLARPDLPITGLAALAMYGLLPLVDGQEVVAAVLDSELKRTKPSRPHASIGRREAVRDQELRYPDPLHPGLACVQPAEALVSAIKSIRKGVVAWYVHDIEGWTREEIRTIQLVDAVRRYFKSSDVCGKLEEVAVGRIDRRWLQKILRASDPGADSPLETTMRLIVNGLLFDGSLVEWESQVPLYQDSTPGLLRADKVDSFGRGSADVSSWNSHVATHGRSSPWLTLADLLCRRFGLILFFDGAHHRSKQQHHRDTEIDAALQSKGFLVLRVTEPMLRNPEGLCQRIIAMLDLSRAA